MLCCTPASRFSNVIVVGAGGSSIVEVSNAMSCATTVGPAPGPPPGAGSPVPLSFGDVWSQVEARMGQDRVAMGLTEAVP